MSNDAFEVFVNAEIPKRISTNDDSTTVAEGLIPVSTGVGLGTTFKSVNDLGIGKLLEVKLASVKNLPVEDYKAELPVNVDSDNIIKPIMVNLDRGLSVEVIDYEFIDGNVVLNPADFVEIEEGILSISFNHAVIEDSTQFEVINLYNVPVPESLLVILEEPVYNKMFLNNAILHLNDGSVVDVFNVKTTDGENRIIDLTEIDVNDLELEIKGLTISYLTSKKSTI